LRWHWYSSYGRRQFFDSTRSSSFNAALPKMHLNALACSCLCFPYFFVLVFHGERLVIQQIATLVRMSHEFLAGVTKLDLDTLFSE